jgi:photosystem II stability/assembly factor-like uncharacterized protein
MLGDMKSRWAARAAALAVAAGALLGSAPASANGRFPASSGIIIHPTDPSIMLARVTFGLLVSRDAGQSWDWVCEQSVGFSGAEDPMYVITENGSIAASTFSGVTRSPAGACDWSVVGAPLGPQVFIDLATQPGSTKAFGAFASSYDRQEPDGGALLFKSVLYESKDEGATFAQLGVPLESSLLGETFDFTKDPDRIYVSAIRGSGAQLRGYLVVSDDRGKTWTERPVPLESGERAPYIAAVDPDNADRVYVRTANAVDRPSRLLVSSDAGKTWKAIFSGTGALLGFALSPDGKKVYVGGPGPGPDQGGNPRPADGLNVASTSDFVFTKRSAVAVQCLLATKDALWGCSNERGGFVLGVSTDDGATFAPKLARLCDVRGPLACAEGTSTARECPKQWAQQRAALGQCDGQPYGSDAGPLDAGGGREAPIDGTFGGYACSAGRGGSFVVLAFGGLALGLLGLRRSRAKRG